jgi:DNA processing protein
VESGFTILSGLALGIDTAAHTAALDAGGSTSAVVGTGLNRVFPPENSGLAERILASGGALLSQFFPAQPPTRWTFPMRNVVMSGLSMATVVVEASETSGARMQARVALQHGRTVFLLRSLVEQHAWAQKYVNEGAYGAFAIEIASTGEIVDRLGAPMGTAGRLKIA